MTDEERGKRVGEYIVWMFIFVPALLIGFLIGMLICHLWVLR